MSLPDDYLTYAHRAYGMDQGLYAWRPRGAEAKDRPFGEALAVMIVVPIEHHTLTPSGKPFKPPGAMVTPYPDLRHYTTRDYGNRVGAFRLLDALRAHGLRATVAVNGDQLKRLAPLVARACDDGHEIAAYGLSADKIHWSGLEEQDERALVAQTRQCFHDVGLTPRAWLSPARQQSFRTLGLLAAEGFDVNLDWEMDERLVAFHTGAGTIAALPLSNELDDRTLLIDKRHSEDDWCDQVLEAANYLASGPGGAQGWQAAGSGF